VTDKDLISYFEKLAEESKQPEAEQLIPEQLQELLRAQQNLGTFKPPVCPYCKRELLEFKEKTLMFKMGLIVHVFWCPQEDCRCLLSMQILPPDQPQEEKRIFTPGGLM